MDNKYIQEGLKKINLPHAIFSKDGPNLNNPDVTKSPKLTPNKYSESNKNSRGIPILNIETPNKGIAKIAAGTNPISVLKIAVSVKGRKYKILIGATNKLVKFLLQISSKNIILKLILALNKKSYKIAAVKIIPIVLL